MLIPFPLALSSSHTHTPPRNPKIQVSLGITGNSLEEKTKFHSHWWLERKGFLPFPSFYFISSVLLYCNICHPWEAVNCFDNEAYDEKNILKQCTHCDFMQKQCLPHLGPISVLHFNAELNFFLKEKGFPNRDNDGHLGYDLSCL